MPHAGRAHARQAGAACRAAAGIALIDAAVAIVVEAIAGFRPRHLSRCCDAAHRSSSPYVAHERSGSGAYAEGAVGTRCVELRKILVDRAVAVVVLAIADCRRGLHALLARK